MRREHVWILGFYSIHEIFLIYYLNMINLIQILRVFNVINYIEIALVSSEKMLIILFKETSVTLLI
jgi:hypothetical protein